MCDGNHQQNMGWKGWSPLPESTRILAHGPWRDLTHHLDTDVPRAEVFPVPLFRKIRSLPEDPLNVTEMGMVVHIGTHVDAPRHFFSDGPAFHEIPPDRLCGTGVVLSIEKGGNELITAADLEAHAGLIRPGDIVAINTGWSRHARSEQYHDHPHLCPQAAQWLVDHKVKLAAFDIPTPDLPIGRRSPDFNWPVHHILLGHGVLVSENLTGLSALNNQRVEFVFAALNIVESDGAPARVFARPVED